MEDRLKATHEIPGSMYLSNKAIEAGYSDNGTLNHEQIRALGADVKKKGWRKQIINTYIPLDSYNEFLSLRNKHIIHRVEKRRAKTKAQNKKGILWSATCQDIYKEFLSKKTMVPATMSREDQYNHPNWQRLRHCIMYRDDYTCRLCGNKDEQLHVHHIQYKKGAFIWDVNPRFLSTICKSCHHKEHGRVF